MFQISLKNTNLKNNRVCSKICENLESSEKALLLEKYHKTFYFLRLKFWRNVRFTSTYYVVVKDI